MAVTATAAFPQTPKIGVANLTTLNTALDGSGTITTVITAGSDGMDLVGLQAIPQETVTATAVRIFISQDSGSSWDYWFDALMPAGTVSTTTANPSAITLIDPEVPDDKRYIPANAVIGATISVSFDINVIGLGVDY